MPVIKSAVKQMRQSRKRNVRNTMRKRKMKNSARDVLEFVKEKKLVEAREAMGLAQKNIDMAAKLNLISRNKAARKKSQLARALAQAGK